VAGGFHHGLHVKEDGGDEQPGGDGVTRIQILDGVQRIPALPINTLRPSNSSTAAVCSCSVRDAAHCLLE
jgi:hypothetical protein